VKTPGSTANRLIVPVTAKAAGNAQWQIQLIAQSLKRRNQFRLHRSRIPAAVGSFAGEFGPAEIFTQISHGSS
jgi:hypothetical protein